MTIRSGGRPRDQRPGSRRFEPDAYATDYVPEGYEPSRRYGNEGRSGRRRGRGGSGLGGLVRFLLFAVLLAGIVLIVALTALRPVVNGAILSWAEDSPAGLRLPFVADIVREDLGTALTRPVSSDSRSFACSTSAEITCAPWCAIRSARDGRSAPTSSSAKAM